MPAGRRLRPPHQLVQLFSRWRRFLAHQRRHDCHPLLGVRVLPRLSRLAAAAPSDLLRPDQ